LLYFYLVFFSAIEEDEAIVFGDEKIHCHKSIEEITSVEVDGSLLQQLEEDIKNKKIFSEE
jgi:hypothetical protein